MVETEVNSLLRNDFHVELWLPLFSCSAVLISLTKTKIVVNENTLESLTKTKIETKILAKRLKNDNENIQNKNENENR